MQRLNACRLGRSSRMLAAVLAGAAVLVLGGCAGVTDHLRQPTIAVELPERYNTPDGMVLDRDGTIILSCPNFNNPQYRAKMLRIDKDNQVTEVCTIPVDPSTGRAGPLGVDVGPDGNLYVADNPAFGTDEPVSRLLRIVMKDGVAERCETVVTGFVQSNAVSCFGDYVYVTETKLDPEASPLVSGVYRFHLSELKAETPVRLKPRGEDGHLLTRITTHNRTWVVGANGLAFDAQGNMYFCNFGDAQILKVTFDENDNVYSQKVFAAGAPLKSTDGLKVDPETGDLYVADFVANAVHRIDAKTGGVTTIARNGNTDGSGGRLDRPSEVCVRGRKVYVSNIDLPGNGNAYDRPHTISVIDLGE